MIKKMSERGGIESLMLTKYAVSAEVVDDRNYRFENVVYVYLSWEDPRAYPTVIESTKAFRNGSLEDCSRPCSSASSGALSRRAEGFHYHDTCCDGVWLPTIGMLK